jgi:hypothetical protein
MLRNKVKTRDGREWSLTRIKLACRRYKEYIARGLTPLGEQQGPASGAP